MIRLRFGDGNDLQIFHKLSNGNSIIQETGSGDLNILGNNEILEISWNENIARFIQDGAVKLYYDNVGSLKPQKGGIVNLITVDNDLLVAGVTTFQGDVNLGDNDRLFVGDGQDLEILRW